MGRALARHLTVRWRRGGRGEPAEPPDAPAQRKDRHRRRGGRGAHRAGPRRGVRAQVRRWGRGGDSDGVCGAALRSQGPYTGRQLDQRTRRQRSRAPQKAGSEASTPPPSWKSAPAGDPSRDPTLLPPRPRPLCALWHGATRRSPPRLPSSMLSCVAYARRPTRRCSAMLSGPVGFRRGVGAQVGSAG